MRRRLRRTYFYLGVLIVLGLLLTGLQYRWSGQVSEAEGVRLENALRSGLERVARDFNQEVAADLNVLFLRGISEDRAERHAAFLERAKQMQGREGNRGPFRKVGLILPNQGEPSLLLYDAATETLAPQPWPAAWEDLRRQTVARLSGFALPPALPATPGQALLVELPHFRTGPLVGDALAGPARSPIGRGEIDWLVAELNPDYYRTTLLPRLLAQQFGTRYANDYRFELAIPGEAKSNLLAKADAEVPVFAIDIGAFNRQGPEPRRLREQHWPVGPPPPVMGPGPARGRWQLLAQHQAGSVEGLVSQARWRNLGVSFFLLALMIGTVIALFRISRRAEELALMQMNFVAGVSHELRTPLTVIRTAAFNLRGRLAAKPEQVEKYGKLIQEESEKLGAMVEQVLRFASANSGLVIRHKQATAVESLVEDGLRSSSLALRAGEIEIDKSVEDGLPPVMVDEQAMRHVLQNLIDNALKYGTDSSNWIGVSARRALDGGKDMVEIRVADRGAGIPEKELEKIFDPFFRGERAVSDQIHGTGLGLNLVKRIVEAHGGTIRVESETGRGSTFIVQLPAAPAESIDEFAHSAG